MGVLSGKYLDGARPQGSRMVRFTRFTRYETPPADAATRAYVALASEHGFDPAQMALAFVSSRYSTTRSETSRVGERVSVRGAFGGRRNSKRKKKSSKS